jgi:hypothetical protein
MPGGGGGGEGGQEAQKPMVGSTKLPSFKLVGSGNS